MVKVAILGAGISGLATAWYLKRKYPGLELDIFEKKDHPGGNICSLEVGGHVTELGPRGVRPKGKGRYFLQLADELGMLDQILPADRSARKRYLYQDGKLEPLPSGPLGLFRSKPLKGWWKAAWYDFQDKAPPPPEGEEESVHAFISRRLGVRIAENLADPFFTGIYAGDTGKLSARAVIPHLLEHEEKYGSIVKGFLADPPEEPEIERSFGALEKAPLVTIKGGMQQLCRRLAASLDDHLKLGTETPDIDSLTENYDKVISTLPAYVLGGMLEEPLKMCLQSVEYAPVAVAALNFNEKLDLPEGFGYLVASNQRQAILGCIFNDQTFPGLSENPGSSLSAMIGGSRMKDFYRYSRADFLAIARETLAVHLKNSRLRVPDAEFVQVWPQAIPQYNTGHLQIVEEIRKLTADSKLFVSGNFISGISVSDCIRQARAVADSLELE